MLWPFFGCRTNVFFRTSVVAGHEKNGKIKVHAKSYPSLSITRLNNSCTFTKIIPGNTINV